MGIKNLNRRSKHIDIPKVEDDIELTMDDHKKLTDAINLIYLAGELSYDHHRDVKKILKEREKRDREKPKNVIEETMVDNNLNEKPVKISKKSKKNNNTVPSAENHRIKNSSSPKVVQLTFGQKTQKQTDQNLLPT